MPSVRPFAGREKLSFLFDSTLRSYSTIFFSQRRTFGFLLLLATFVEPIKGLLGLFALLCSNALAYLLGFERSSIRKGYFGFNSLLLGLSLSFFYAPSWNLLLLIFLSSLLTTLVVSALNGIFSYYFRLPSLSLPFVIVFSLAVSASVGFGKLELSSSTTLVTPPTLSVESVDLLLKSLGSTFFQVNVISGALVLLGLLLYSRIAFLLGVAGLASGYITHYLLGAYPQVLTEQYLGFNYILTGIALGGIFLVPSSGSLLLAVAGASASTVVLLSAKVLFPAFLSPTALPFNLITLLVLYALRMRFFPSANLTLSQYEVSSPEENLSSHRVGLMSFRRHGIELSFPFHGNWVVTQGFNGKMTHKEDWRFALDFMVSDSEAKLFKGSGLKAEEYFCFNVPILAPADGKVAFVKDDVPDNPVGKINERDSWGNAVILEHAYQFYSCVAHLKHKSASIKVGDSVKKGQVMARCGNSGRSPFPHLHFQIQPLPQLGAPTLYFHFSNFVKMQDSQKSFIPRGEPMEGEQVSNISYPADYLDFFPYSFTQDFVYAVKENEEQQERWSTEIDFYGNLMMKSTPLKTRLYFTLVDGVLSVKKLEGSRKSGLFHFGKLLTDVPIVLRENFKWYIEEETDSPLPQGVTFFLDSLAIFGVRFKFELENALESTKSSLKLTSKARFKMKTPVGSFYPSRRERVMSYTFGQNLGLVHYEDEGLEIRLLGKERREEEGG